MVLLDIIPRKFRKKIALLLFTFAIVLSLPPSIPFGEVFSDIFLNFPLGTFISERTGIQLINALIITYTLIPVLIILLASIIHPAETGMVFNGFFIKLKNSISKYIQLVKRKPIILVITFVVFYLLFLIVNNYYITQINIFILT